MPTTRIQGQLEIDHDRGVIYFHMGGPADPSSDDIDYSDMLAKYGTVTILRICRLPTPIPVHEQLDIAMGHGCSWNLSPTYQKQPPPGEESASFDATDLNPGLGE